MPDQVMYATTLDWIGGPTGDGKTIEQHAEELAAKHGVTFKAATVSGYHHDGFDVLFTSPDRDKLKALYLDGGPGDFDESFVVQVLGLEDTTADDYENGEWELKA